MSTDLLNNTGAAAHVLVWGVGAGPDEADADVDGPVVLLGDVAQLADGVGQIRGEGAVHVGLQGWQVDLHYLLDSKEMFIGYTYL